MPPPLPAGYTIDTPAGPALPPLPKGYTLDAPAASPPAPTASSKPADLARQQISVFGLPVGDIAPPLINMLDYPAREVPAYISGLIEGGVLHGEINPEGFWAGRERVLRATEIPETPTGRTISTIASIPSELIGGAVKAGSQAILGPEITKRLGPAAQLAADIAPLGAGRVAGALDRYRGVGAPVPPPTVSQNLLQDFEKQGVMPNVPAVGQGRGAAALTSKMATNMPVVGPVVRQAAGKTLADTSAAVDRAAQQYGTVRDTSGAGSVIKNAVTRFAEDRSQAGRDYNDFFAKMQGAPPAPVTNTLDFVQKQMGRFKNAPGLAGIFTSSPIAKLAAELEPRTVTIPAKTSGMLDQFGKPTIVAPAQTVQRGGVLSMPELKELRSQVGYKLEHPSFGPDEIPRAQLKQLYGALTKDLTEAARTQGPDALKALTRANTNYGIRMKLIDRLEPLGKGDAPERVFTRLNSAAASTGTADAGLLVQVKKVATPQEWGDFGATVIARMGRATPGATDILAETKFSPSSFATNWAKLTDRAKDQLFGPNTAGSPRSGLEALARISQAQKNVERLTNYSRSGEYGLTGALAAEVLHATWGALTTGQLGELAGVAAGGATAFGAAKILMSPGFARWLYQLPKIKAATPEGAVAGGLAALSASVGARTAPSTAPPARPGLPPPPIPPATSPQLSP